MPEVSPTSSNNSSYSERVSASNSRPRKNYLNSRMKSISIDSPDNPEAAGTFITENGNQLYELNKKQFEETPMNRNRG